MVFLLTSLFSPVQYRGKNSEKIDFLTEKLETFEIVKWSQLDFVLQKEHYKIYFSLTSRFSPLQHRGRNSEIDFSKKTWKSFEIVKWSQMDSAQLKITKKWFFC